MGLLASAEYPSIHEFKYTDMQICLYPSISKHEYVDISMNMIQNDSDYVMCEDGKHAIINEHNGYITIREINDNSCNIDDFKIVATKKI